MGGWGSISATEASACQRPNGVGTRCGFLRRCRAIFEQRSVGVDALPTELVAHLGRGRLYRPGDRLGDVLDMGWLQLSLAASEQGKHGQMAQHSRDWADKGVASSEHRGRADQRRRRKFLPNNPFSLPAATNVGRCGSGIRANAGNMDQMLDARFPGSRATRAAPVTWTEWKVCCPLST
jgi:hypothetical protein